MPASRRRILAVVAATTSLTGCIGSDDPETVGGPTATDSRTETDSPTATGSPTAGDPSTGVTVQVRSHPEHGDVLVGPEGLTLYMFDSDTQGAGESTCYDGCAEAWPPLTVDGDPTRGDGVTTDLSTFGRESGDSQVAAGGWPLYYFDSDEEPGDANGQGVNDVWWVLAPDGTPLRPESGAETTTTPTATSSDDGGYYDESGV